ncbi:four helix bundle protein [Jiulongibacter sp. NS-SX5]|uniref:four helix bundle protein n=1 Tax=Jiulongibacter sp. NS-SX5 TaxID=3463854 RepID=UPI0040599C4F
MRDFKKYDVWVNAHSFVLDVYQITQSFPIEEKFGLISQYRRAAVSITNNIAEGCAKRSEKDFARFLEMAAGSSFECQNLNILSKDLGFIDIEVYNNFDGKVVVIKKQLYQLINKLK